MKTKVMHIYHINMRGKSAYGRAKATLEALEPLKMLSSYGFKDDVAAERVTIWWETEEEVGKR